MSELLPPLVPAEVDLRDFEFQPMQVQRILTSETWILGSGDERAAAITLWMQSWHQVPAGSLPDNDKMLDHLSMSKRWKQVKDHALRGWLTCSDGRLYHPVVCEKALEAWIEKLGNSLSGNAGNAKRWGISIDLQATRQQMLDAIGMLRALAPQSKTFRKKLVLSILADSGGESPPDIRTESPPDSPTDRKGQGQGHRKRNTPHSPPGGGRFAEFWEAWPASKRKGGKAVCLTLWERGNLDPQADAILAHVRAMRGTTDWTKQAGEFVPAPEVYLRGKRWDGADAGATGPADDIFAGAV